MVIHTSLSHQVCDFIQGRDGYPADPDNIFLTNGASEAVRMILRCLIRGPNDGVLVPVPQVYTVTVICFLHMRDDICYEC